MKNWLSKYPVYVWLLPVFFVLHTLWQYQGLVTFSVGFKILLEAELVTTLVYGLLRKLFSSGQKAGLVVTAANTIQFFFGAFKDALASRPYLSYLSHYAVLLPMMVFLFAMLLLMVRRKHTFERSNIFLTLLFLLFILADAVRIAWDRAEARLSAHRLISESLPDTSRLPVQVERPDIYLLVLDSYPGEKTRRQYLGEQTAEIDSGLAKRGFYVVRRSSSNYNKTALSMASTLNMQYLQGIQADQPLAALQYNECSLSIRESLVPSMLGHYGYSVVNLSCFDIARYPAFRKEDFLVLPPEKMFVYSTFPACFERDLSWHFPWLPFLGKDAAGTGNPAEIFRDNYWKKEYNDAILDSLQRMPLQPLHEPVFVYAHLYLPHPPFFYDANGRGLGPDINIPAQMEDPKALLEYVRYTNHQVFAIADAITRHAVGPLAIIVMSDHGYRDLPGSVMPAGNYFDNFCAVYFSDRNYPLLYDSMSNVNVFPVLFNKYFRTSLPLRRDSIVHTPY